MLNILMILPFILESQLGLKKTTNLWLIIHYKKEGVYRRSFTGGFLKPSVNETYAGGFVNRQ